MATYFPANPTLNQTYQPEGSSTQYIWTGTYWAVQNNTRPLFNPALSGSLVTIDSAGYAVSTETVLTNGVLIGTASLATTASFANTASAVNRLTQAVIISGSLTVTGSLETQQINNAQQSVITGSNYSGILGGIANVIRAQAGQGRDFNTILNGSNNTLTQSIASVAGGNSAIISGSTYGFAFGNNIGITGKTNAAVIGNNITASFNDTLHVNNLWVSGSVTASGGFNGTASFATTASTAFRTVRPTTGLQWANIYGGPAATNPSATGGNLVGSATFMNNVQGVRLTTTLIGQTGTIWWNLTGSGTVEAFDFMQDFRASFMTYYAATVGDFTKGDGHFFNMGGNGSSTSTYAVADNSLSISYDPYGGAIYNRAFINGVTFGSSSLMHYADISSVWAMWTVEVRRNARNNRRECTVATNGKTQVVFDVTSWAPAGKILTVGAWTGGATADQYVHNVKIEYI